MYKQILVPVDLNDQGFSDKALKTAVWHAKHSNAKLHLLNVLPGIHMSMVATYFPKDAAKKMKQDVEKQLKSLPLTISQKKWFTALMWLRVSRLRRFLNTRQSWGLTSS